jgi:hypothetical protein
MEFFIICFVICITCIILLFRNDKSQARIQKEKVRLINLKIDDLRIKYNKLIILGYESNNKELYYVGFDNVNKELLIKTKWHAESNIKYDNIIGVELIENGKTTLSFGSIATGFAVAGSTGAIIGAMNKKNIIVNRKIRFTLNDFDNPSYEMNLLNNGDNTGFWNDIASEANKIMETINYVIRNKQEVM